MTCASNLVAGDTNYHNDVFVRDRMAQLTRRVSVGQTQAVSGTKQQFFPVPNLTGHAPAQSIVLHVSTRPNHC